ncbi:MAG: ATP-dependent DNA helicase RecG [Pseudomonadales bacterium]
MAGPIDPQQPVTALRGVGPSLAEKLARLGVERLLDLLLHLPSRYQDRTRIVPLGALRADQEGLVSGRIVAARLTYGRRRSLLVTLEDGTGFLNLRLFYFSRAQQAALQPGIYVQAYGRARFGHESLELVHPEYRTFHEPPGTPEGTLTPVYPITQGLGQARLRALTGQLLERDWPEGEGLPFAALKFLHRPPPAATPEDIAHVQATVARDELTAYYLVMRRRQALRQQQPAVPLPQAQHLGRQLLKNLGFALTGAQKRVVREVLEDLTEAKPMWRLLQGDVGAGKTVVAAFAAIRACEHGCQTALMAPTEILAEQHYLTFSEWLTPLGIRVVLLTGSQSARERNQALAAIGSGEAQVAVGTHALFQDQVVFRRLVLTIVDEQHRFGVHQRMALRAKGELPHQLVMTATPIPRTLTMALYADMDVSVIDELPSGRRPIETRVLADGRRDEVIARMAVQLERGEQAYWICPLIEESDEVPAASVETTAAHLIEALPRIQVGVLHGRMKGEEKAAIMARFKAADIQLLVATTVVEVGVDVPNATLMVIENPERLGLAQLHQLRGRVGRGRAQSHCVLLYHGPLSEVSRARLEVIRSSQDGFYIAEQDLVLRGPGDLMGLRQTGEQQFRIADLREHAHMIPEAVALGDRLLAEDPETVTQLLRIWAPADTGPIGV